MNKRFKGVCAAALTLTLLTTTLTACGKKIERNNVNSQSYINSNGSYSDGNINNVVPADGNNNSVETPNNGNSGNVNYGGNYSGGNSSGNYSSGNNYSQSAQIAASPEEPTASVADNSGSSTTKRSSLFNRLKIERTTTVRTTTVKTAKTPTSSRAKIEVDIPRVLNSAPLTPVKTNDAELDQLADNILSNIIKPNMNTHQKVVTIYDHLVQNYRYGFMPLKSVDSPYVSAYDADVVARARNFLKYKTGICVDFSAAFMVLTRRIGLNCYLVSGQIANKYGEYNFHGWNIMRINGIDYAFDPEADFRFSTGGPTKYYTFCVNDPVKFDPVLTNSFAAMYRNFRTF